MENHDCFVHAFKTPNNFYLYDVNTNSILKISNDIYQFFHSIEKKQINDKSLMQIEKMKTDGFLKRSPLKKIEHQLTEFLPSILDRKVQSITLQVTQQCNLRCKYCVYSGQYKTREHSVKSMSLETAKKSIDFLIQHSADKDEVDIAFYGGEPLLQFKMIKSIVEYAHIQTEGKTVRFHMTTNGTVFTDENLSFLQEKNFGVLISLDGPKEIHDKNRVFAINGKGSFDIIMSNISKIKKEFPGLYSRLMFNAVIDPSSGITCTNQFFIKCADVEGAQLSVSVISGDYKKEKMKIPDVFFVEEEVDKFKMFLHKIGRMESSKISPITKDKFSQINHPLSVLRKLTRTLPETCHPSGPCIPGGRKLFVNVDGQFYPCEKVSEGSVATSIGSVDDGFDLNKIDNLLNPARLTENECKQCWSFRLCSQCFLTADDTNGLSREKKLSICHNTKVYNDKILKDFCTLLEYGYVFESDSTPLFIY